MVHVMDAQDQRRCVMIRCTTRIRRLIRTCGASLNEALRASRLSRIGRVVANIMQTTLPRGISKAAHAVRHRYYVFFNASDHVIQLCCSCIRSPWARTRRKGWSHCSGVATGELEFSTWKQCSKRTNDDSITRSSPNWAMIGLWKRL